MTAEDANKLEEPLKHLAREDGPRPRSLCAWKGILGGILVLNPNEVTCTHCLAIMDRR